MLGVRRRNKNKKKIHWSQEKVNNPTRPRWRCWNVGKARQQQQFNWFKNSQLDSFSFRTLLHSPLHIIYTFFNWKIVFSAFHGRSSAKEEQQETRDMRDVRLDSFRNFQVFVDVFCFLHALSGSRTFTQLRPPPSYRPHIFVLVRWAISLSISSYYLLQKFNSFHSLRWRTTLMFLARNFIWLGQGSLAAHRWC